VSKGPGRLIAFVAAVLVVVVAAAAAYLLLPRQTGGVAVPPREASPEQVVTAYLDALNAHECATAKALITADAEDSATSWCQEVGSLTKVDVPDHFTERPEASGHSAPDEVATIWGYLLVRDSGDSPWRIFDQGRG
jgi:hypothetical protein